MAVLSSDIFISFSLFSNPKINFLYQILFVHGHFLIMFTIRSKVNSRCPNHFVLKEKKIRKIENIFMLDKGNKMILAEFNKIMISRLVVHLYLLLYYINYSHNGVLFQARAIFSLDHPHPVMACAPQVQCRVWLNEARALNLVCIVT